MIRATTPPFFQHPQSLQQQGALVRARDIVADIVAHHGIEALIREGQPVCVPMQEPAPVGHALACSIFPHMA